MLKNKSNKPLYIKKSKAAKQRELEEQEEYEDSFTVDSENHRPRRKGRTRYRLVEYSDYENDLDEGRFYINRGQVETSEQTVEDRRYRRHRPRLPKFDLSESDGSCSECSEEFKPQGRRRRVRLADPWNVMDYEAGPRRRRNKQRMQPDLGEERPNLRKKYCRDCVSPQPVSPRALKDNRTRSKHRSESTDSSDTEFYDEDTEAALGYSKRYNNKADDGRSYYNREYSPRADGSNTYRQRVKEGARDARGRNHRQWPYSQRDYGHRYEVYVAGNQDNTSKVFGQQSRSTEEKEKVLPMLALTEPPMSPHITGSEMIYLPVVVVENGMQPSDSRVMSHNERMKNVREEAEKPLETNVQVYAVTNIEQGNIFQREQQHSEAANTVGTQNISLFTVVQEERHPFQKENPSRSLLDAKKTQSESSSSVNKYPVKKSYINVALSKLTPSFHSLIGSTGPGRVRGSGFFSKAHKKDKKLLQKIKQNRTKRKKHDSDNVSSESLISVINQNEHQNEQHERKDEHRTLKSSKSKDARLNETIETPLENNTKSTTNLRKSLPQENKAQEEIESNVKTINNKKTTEDPKISLLSTRQSGTDTSIYSPNYNDEQNKVHNIRQSTQVKRQKKPVHKSHSWAVSGLSHNKARKGEENDPGDENLHVPKIEKIQNKPSVGRKKTIMQRLLRVKSSSSGPVESQNSKPSIQDLELDTMEKDLDNMEQTIAKKTEPGMEDEQSYTLVILGYDCSFWVHVFEVLIVFVGLNIHGSLIDMLNCFGK